MINALASLTDSIGPHLFAVEQRFHDELSSDLRCVNTLVKHVSRFRGKMLRPSLVLLAAKATGDIKDSHVSKQASKRSIPSGLGSWLFRDDISSSIWL